MIKVEHIVEINEEQLKFVIEGMRNPKNSWNKSDTDSAEIGENDNDLMTKLFKAGTEHRKYLRMMNVGMRITAPLYWWKEFDTYKVGTIANSCSTMHKIQAKEFMLDDFSHEHLTVVSEDSGHASDIRCLLVTISFLNYNREKYLQTKEKKYWWNMIQLLPSSYNQTRNVMLNYEVLANICRQRKGHKLDEWHDFIEVVKGLRYAYLLGLDDGRE